MRFGGAKKCSKGGKSVELHPIALTPSWDILITAIATAIGPGRSDGRTGAPRWWSAADPISRPTIVTTSPSTRPRRPHRPDVARASPPHATYLRPTISACTGGPTTRSRLCRIAVAVVVVVCTFIIIIIFFFCSLFEYIIIYLARRVWQAKIKPKRALAMPRGYGNRVGTRDGQPNQRVFETVEFRRARNKRAKN